MNEKKEQLINIIKSASLPSEVETLLLNEVEAQTEITDAFIDQVADTLEQVGAYLKTMGEVQDEYLDSLLAEAEKTGKALDVLSKIKEQVQLN